MASVLRKVTISEFGQRSRSLYLACRYNAPLHTSSSWSVASGGSTGKLRKHLISRNNSEPLALHSNHARTQVVEVPYQYQSQRSMSILTDLLRRRKKRDSSEEAEDEEAIPDAKTLPLIEDLPKALSDEEIEAKRDKSGLNQYHRRLVNGQLPYPEPLTWIHQTVRYKKKMFGRYGESSGVNPGILWPSREELQNQIEYENICYPFTIQEMVEKKNAERQRERAAYEARAKEVEEKMAMIDKFKDELVRKQEAKDRETAEAKARREKLVEDVRRHFGYTVDPRDERFQEMLAKKEKEQKKNMKEARKLEKQQRALDKLEEKSKPSKKPTKTAEAKGQAEVEND